MRRCFLVFACLVLGGLITFIGQSFLQGQGSASRPGAGGGAAAADGGPREVASFRDVVKKVLPAVVSIDAQAKGGGGLRTRRPGDMQFDGGGGPRGGLPLPLPVDEDSTNPNRVGFGSGFIISPKGIIVTNNHVVENADQVTVQMSTGRKLVSKTIRTDAKTDLAVIILGDLKENLPYLEFGDSDDMEIGDRVLAVGAPFGLTGTVTHGIISGKGRALKMNMYEDFLQTDAAINPGNSGGPLVSLDGKVIGISSAIKSRSGGFQGIGLAISSNLAKSISEQLVKDGVVRRGYLGIGIRDLDEELARAAGLKEALGVQVTRVYPDAPGDKAGLKSGDVIRALGGKPIRDSRELQTAVAGQPIGKPVDLQVYREGRLQKLKVTVQEQPKTFGTTASKTPRIPDAGSGALFVEKVGLTVTDLTPELSEALGYPDSVRGALITRITRDGLADVARLNPGMVIVAVDRKATTTAKQAAQALAAGSPRKGIALQVRGPRAPLQTIILRQE